MSLGNWFQMGGYGIYVWPAYGITLLVFVINFFYSIIQKKKIKKQLQAYYAVESVLP